MGETATETTARRTPFASGGVAVVALVQAVVLTVLSGAYGFHRDEFYYVAAGKRLAWGYVDQPPLTPALARLATTLFGETPAGLRVVATAAGVATVVVLALVARELDGGYAAQVVTAAVTALSGYVLVVSHMLSTTTIDMLLWSVLSLFAIKLLRSGDNRWWLAVGATTGVALLNKWLVPLLLAALGIAVLIAGPRRIFRTWWLLAGVALALALVSPVLVWEARHGFPMFTVAGGISEDDGVENRLTFVPLQLAYLSPVLVPVWVAGIVRLWKTPRLRAIALSYPVLCVLLVVAGGKPYYSLPLLLVLTAAGVQPALDWFARRRARRWWLVAAALGAVVSLVVGLPILPTQALGPVLALNKEQGEQVGWPGFVTTVAGVWRQLPGDDRAGAVIFTSNYGEAGAIEHFAADDGLPAPYSGHMSYADWGPPPDRLDGPVVLVGEFDRPARAFTGCRVVATQDTGVDNDEQGTPVSLCTGTTAPWSVLWPSLRHFY
ncbi:glycosyltransferase family 39 protein [Amycolatopsis sp. NPDC051903]|uniref:glycosyltransferase family 39 protein n=1 Tax=Amycolatopsis sp. NPDC051903 TaxID=3363936 RepID=UPI003787F5AA